MSRPCVAVSPSVPGSTCRCNGTCTLAAHLRAALPYIPALHPIHARHLSSISGTSPEHFGLLTERPVSTLMPGRMPCSRRVSTNGLPSAPDWYSVSSNMMHPEMYCPSPGAVYNSSRQSRRLVSVFSTPAHAWTLEGRADAMADASFDGDWIMVSLICIMKGGWDLTDGVQALPCGHVRLI